MVAPAAVVSCSVDATPLTVGETGLGVKFAVGNTAASRPGVLSATCPVKPLIADSVTSIGGTGAPAHSERLAPGSATAYEGPANRLPTRPAKERCEVVDGGVTIRLSVHVMPTVWPSDDRARPL
ncbi:MAG: hypothetical protein ACK558_13700 [Pseudomonadota bacterium]